MLGRARVNLGLVDGPVVTVKRDGVKVAEDGFAGGSMDDLRAAGQYRTARPTVKKEVRYPLLGVETGDVIKEGYERYGPEGALGVAPKEPLPQDDSRRFEDRMNNGVSAKEKVQKDFG